MEQTSFKLTNAQLDFLKELYAQHQNGQTLLENFLDFVTGFATRYAQERGADINEVYTYMDREFNKIYTKWEEEYFID